ncbi:hypothetical protein CAC42_2083 [Sphaceloma murrayae]|uniref:Uncharacterized protein n=1 Tax=Sphaceloma murrayae TaxID=2082308 RepID=A0A2K1QI60_9PEZI|nr:hypothetical protein CAC42_2083 [Sphaceloma murrayae]
MRPRSFDSSTSTWAVIVRALALVSVTFLLIAMAVLSSFREYYQYSLGWAGVVLAIGVNALELVAHLHQGRRLPRMPPGCTVLWDLIAAGLAAVSCYIAGINVWGWISEANHRSEATKGLASAVFVVTAILLCLQLVLVLLDVSDYCDDRKRKRRREDERLQMRQQV